MSKFVVSVVTSVEGRDPLASEVLHYALCIYCITLVQVALIDYLTVYPIYLFLPNILSEI